MEHYPRGKTVVVAMSGGVDSSVAAALLKEQGYNVIGISYQVQETVAPAARAKGCCSLDDFLDARVVANKLDIPYYVISVAPEFKKEVIDYFTEEYLAGNTPNPCVKCNEKIKFELFLNKAMELGGDYVATGHYCSVNFNEETQAYELIKGLDEFKDQTYFLFTLNQDQLSKVLFPLGGLTKKEVRDLAFERGLINHNKRDSQEICFIENSYREFIEGQISFKDIPSGEIRDLQENVLGKHKGLYQFTIGQRKGIPIESLEPIYVVRKDSLKNVLYVGNNKDLMRDTLIAKEVHWINPKENYFGKNLMVKIRSRFQDKIATLTETPSDSNSVQIKFTEPLRAITPGQAVVFYDGPKVVGGGWIKSC